MTTDQKYKPEPGQIPVVSVDQDNIKDRWWLLAFLLHTAAYLGASAWINYAALSSDKLSSTDGTDGPVNT
jgi:hypothetical protein